MGFDSEGNLYVTTGDTNSSQGTGGYSGNNPTPKCPTGPARALERALRPDDLLLPGRAPHGGQHQRLQRQDAAVPAARTSPRASSPRSGAGTTYALPTEDSPNGPNLFDGTEGGGGKAKPEIYAMGLRNPSRLAIDPGDRHPVHARGSAPTPARRARPLGPSTYENASQIDRAGNYGWPYCMGNGQAYRDRVADGSQRTTNAPGYVAGGPASGGTDGWYDCDNILNDSPNNTGLTELPHETGTGMDAGKMRHVNLWYSRGNRRANGCPNYPRDRGAGNAPNYGGTPTSLCPYAIDQGMTVMNGPVYRYDEDADDDSRRWPEYWDGRWFLHNNGGASDQARPAARSGRRIRTAASRSTPTASATRCRGRAPTWTRSSGRTAPCTCRRTTASSGPTRTSASPATATRAGRTRRSPTRQWELGRAARSSSRARAPAASPSRVGLRRRRDVDRAQPDAPVRRGGPVRRRADGDVRGRHDGHQDDPDRRGRHVGRHRAGDDAHAQPGACRRAAATPRPGDRHARRDGRGRQRPRHDGVPRRRRRLAGVRHDARGRGDLRRLAGELRQVESRRRAAGDFEVRPDGVDADRGRPGHALVRRARRTATSRCSSSGARPARTTAGPTAARSCASRTRTRSRRCRPSDPGRPACAGNETQPAWVAIYCGHEIQVHDNPGGGEPQKTGSIYNFQPLDIAQARPVAEGRLDEVRDPRRRPAVHDHPRRQGHQRVRQLDRQGVVARGRSADAAAPVRARATSACRTTAAPT